MVTNKQVSIKGTSVVRVPQRRPWDAREKTPVAEFGGHLA